VQTIKEKHNKCSIIGKRRRKPNNDIAMGEQTPEERSGTTKWETIKEGAEERQSRWR